MTPGRNPFDRNPADLVDRDANDRVEAIPIAGI
jgi:hypothetical protein